ncbi:hypothetical protein F4780DRAFT_775138 [Xylariomycetidae sp. FL0641]|nr:hypothetical protein F4780DRAFT_775138 [Xylariomycetidae sp. FL0641]
MSELGRTLSILEIAPGVWNARYSKATATHAGIFPLVSDIIAAHAEAQSPTLRRKVKNLGPVAPFGGDGDHEGREAVGTGTLQIPIQTRLWELLQTTLKPNSCNPRTLPSSEPSSQSLELMSEAYETTQGEEVSASYAGSFGTPCDDGPDYSPEKNMGYDPTQLSQGYPSDRDGQDLGMICSGGYLGELDLPPHHVTNGEYFNSWSPESCHNEFTSDPPFMAPDCLMSDHNVEENLDGSYLDHDGVGPTGDYYSPDEQEAMALPLPTNTPFYEPESQGGMYEPEYASPAAPDVDFEDQFLEDVNQLDGDPDVFRRY